VPAVTPDAATARWAAEPTRRRRGRRRGSLRRHFAEGYDAGVRLTEAIERDMVQTRLTGAFRFVVVGAPSYLARQGMPERPEDLLRYECFTFRTSTARTLYAWELERGRRNWRIPVRGVVVTNNSQLRLSLAEQGSGLTTSSSRWRQKLFAPGASNACSSPTPRRCQASSSTTRAAPRRRQH
jgi:DNA-binding transcriptional LysR family regulator